MPIAINVNTSYSSCMMYMTTGRGGRGSSNVPKETEQCAVENLFLFLFLNWDLESRKLEKLKKGSLFPCFPNK